MQPTRLSMLAWIVPGAAGALGLLVAVPALLGLGLLVLAMLARGAMTG